MDIYPLGHASFRIKGKTATVVTDPFDQAAVGLKFPKLEVVDIVTISHGHGDHNHPGNVPGDPFVVSGPGEYEIKGVTIIGVPTFHDESQGSARGKNIVYKIAMDEVCLCHLGDLGHKLTEAQRDQIGDVDVLFVPVGGFYTIDATTATQVVAQLEPRIVVPMHYKRPGMPEETFGQLAGVEKFVKEMGAEGVAAQPKLVISKEKLPETTTVVVLE